MSKNCEGWLVGVWEGLNLGSIPNDHMPSQKDPKFLLKGGVVQFCRVGRNTRKVKFRKRKMKKIKSIINI